MEILKKTFTMKNVEYVYFPLSTYEIQMLHCIDHLF